MNDEGRLHSAPATSIDYRCREASTEGGGPPCGDRWLGGDGVTPRLVITIPVEGRPSYRVECDDPAAHRNLLLWLARAETRERLSAALVGALERLPGRMEA